MVIWSILKLVDLYLCNANYSYWLMTNHKKLKTWYVNLTRDSVMLKTELKFVTFSGLFTFDVKADEELQMELIYSVTQYWNQSFLRLRYQVFTLSSPGINPKKLLNLHNKYVECLAGRTGWNSCYCLQKGTEHSRDYGWQTRICHRLWTWFQQKI